MIKWGSDKKFNQLLKKVVDRNKTAYYMLHGTVIFEVVLIFTTSVVLNDAKGFCLFLLMFLLSSGLEFSILTFDIHRTLKKELQEQIFFAHEIEGCKKEIRGLVATSLLMLIASFMFIGTLFLGIEQEFQQGFNDIRVLFQLLVL